MVVEQNIIKIKEHSFTRVNPSPVSMKLGAKNVSYVVFIKLKDEFVFLCFNDFNFFQNKWHATDSQTAILYNFEEYYTQPN